MSNPPETSPCPFCQSANTQAVMTGTADGYAPLSHHVHCLDCGGDGPGKATKEEAIAAWSAAPCRDEVIEEVALEIARAGLPYDPSFGVIRFKDAVDIVRDMKGTKP